jgi:predicted RNase H-like nuclease
MVQLAPLPDVIAIDIPIGLPDQGPRLCDQAARRLLSPYRTASVFSAPIRSVLKSESYAEASNQRFSVEGKKMSRQAWNITAKIKEIDALLRQDSERVERFYEVHPEVSFYHIAGGRPMRYSKKTKEGQNERLGLLEPWFGAAIFQALHVRPRGASQVDDLLDAFAALWSAGRISTGQSKLIPEGTIQKDHFGLPMAIYA